VSLLNPNKYRVIYISASRITPRHFYWKALRQLDCEPRFNRGQAKQQLHQVVLDLTENQQKVPVVIIDEAYLLDRKMLEEIRFLLNFRMDLYNPMSLILIGHPKLYEAIAQRVNLRFQLPPMEQKEIKDYVVHHYKDR
jgi:type II secretory pathway predicted ATPase ExeA